MKTAYLGQYTDEVANAIAGELERSRIRWHHKQAGAITRILFAGEWGTRLFVDEGELERARAIADRVTRDRSG